MYFDFSGWGRGGIEGCVTITKTMVEKYGKRFEYTYTAVTRLGRYFLYKFFRILIVITMRIQMNRALVIVASCAAVILLVVSLLLSNCFVKRDGKDTCYVDKVVEETQHLNVRIYYPAINVKDAQSGISCIKQRRKELSRQQLQLLKQMPKEAAESDQPLLASAKNQIMSDMLNQVQIPADYANTMISLYRNKTQDVLTRDFAVQHIGLYAQALNRRNEYNAALSESKRIRSVLFDAAAETDTIVAAAAFRALADLSVFDSTVDIRRFDSMLIACAGNSESAALAARTMAVQLCGERRVKESRAVLVKIISNKSNSEILRRSAKRAILSIDGKKFTQ